MKNSKKKKSLEMEILGGRIRARRVAVHISQEALAFSLGCSTSYISNLEAGRASCNVQRLIQIAGLLKTDAASLLTDIVPTKTTFLSQELDEGYRKLAPAGRSLLLQILNSILQIEEYQRGISEDDDI